MGKAKRESKCRVQNRDNCRRDEAFNGKKLGAGAKCKIEKMFTGKRASENQCFQMQFEVSSERGAAFNGKA